MPLYDFELPNDVGGKVRFDAELRAERPTLLFFYRGHW